MSHKLTPARQNSLLAKCSWDPDGRRLRVACTHHTEPLLRLAGISHPRACETYLVPAMRDNSGFLVIDHDRRAESESNGELFERGGLLAGMEQEELLRRHYPIRFVSADSPRGEVAGMVEETKALISERARRFDIPTGPHSKVRVLVIAMDDKALPSPNERELWESRTPVDADVYAAAHALCVAQELKHFER